MQLLDITQNVQRQLEALRAFTATPGEGTTRFPFTQEARDASDYLAAEMRAAGLTVHMDNSGSVIGRLEGEVPETVMIGSHLDSVFHGGAYDGIAGVVCAIETARMVVASGKKPHYSLEVIATNDEEGSRFQSGLFTGKVLGGQLSVADIQSYKDANGISVYEAMNAYGLAPDEIADHVREDIKAFIEVHIEQGPVLEDAQTEIGIVDIIVGIRRLRVTIEGRADHVGTMPMHMRKDAMEVASKVVANIGDRARTFDRAVATVGSFTLEPNIINIVPSRVSFSVDVRGAEQSVIDAQCEALLADVARETERFGMTFSVAQTLDVAPVEMDTRLRAGIEASAAAHGYSNMHLISGAGHDAEVFGVRMPASMIFVPSIGGRSHCPEEESAYESLAKAAVITYDVLVGVNEEQTL